MNHAFDVFGFNYTYGLSVLMREKYKSYIFGISYKYNVTYLYI